MATQVEERRQAASQAWDAYSAEMARYNDDNLPTPEQAAHIDELRGTATSAQLELSRVEEFQRNRAQWESQEADMRRASGNRPPVEPVNPNGRQRIQPVSQRLIQSPEYQRLAQEFGANWRVPQNFTQRLMEFRGFSELDMRSELVTGSNTESGAGTLVIPDRYPTITELGRRPLTIRQLITNLTTNSDSVEYVRIVAETSNAAPVPEANVTDPETSGGEPGYKPESGMEFEKKTTPVKTIAHWMPATTRALSDASQLRGLIDSFLRYYLDLELEDQIVVGNGIGENFEGILETDGIQEQPYIVDTNDNAFFHTARTARRKVRTIGRRIPTAYILNPEDWERLDLATDDVKRFYSQGPFSEMTPILWGLPVVESEAVPVGTGIVGDLRTCVLWDREQASISVSNSHADFFIRNLVAILAELRAAFGVLKPNALVVFETEPGS
jgi:HK97 family phage major capsid protein